MTYPHTMQLINFRGQNCVRAVYYTGNRQWIVDSGTRYYRNLHW